MPSFSPVDGPGTWRHKIRSTLSFLTSPLITSCRTLGWRRAELLALDVDDVDLQSRWVRVRRKGGKCLSVPLLEAVADWLEFRPDVDHEGLFVGIQGERLGVEGVAKVFEKAAAKADVDRDGVSLHTLRHTFASLLLQEGCDLVSIQELLGHADLASTSIYLHMDASHVQSVVEKHPLSRNAYRVEPGGSTPPAG